MPKIFSKHENSNKVVPINGLYDTQRSFGRKFGGDLNEPPQKAAKSIIMLFQSRRLDDAESGTATDSNFYAEMPAGEMSHTPLYIEEHLPDQATLYDSELINFVSSKRQAFI